METLVHTSDGKLQVDNPFLRVGTKGVYRADNQYRFHITEATIARTKQNKEYNRECCIFVWWEHSRAVTGPYYANQLTITE